MQGSQLILIRAVYIQSLELLVACQHDARLINLHVQLEQTSETSDRLVDSRLHWEIRTIIDM